MSVTGNDLSPAIAAFTLVVTTVSSSACPAVLSWGAAVAGTALPLAGGVAAGAAVVPFAAATDGAPVPVALFVLVVVVLVVVLVFGLLSQAPRPSMETNAKSSNVFFMAVLYLK